jgi:hypothetical protein
MTLNSTAAARPSRDEARRATDALKSALLIELAPKQRTTQQLTALLGADRQVVYRALLALQVEGKVTSFKDRRKSALGDAGLVWSLSGPKPIEVPPKDPLLWAVFGTWQRPSA